MFKKTFFVVLLTLLMSFSSFALEDVDLFNKAKKIFGILPEKMKSKDNRITDEKVKLGKILFYDMRLSIDNTVSCAKCHFFGLYGTDGLPRSIGDYYRANDRNAPTIFNAANQISQHWAGEMSSVEEQAEKSLTGKSVFGNPNEETLIKRLVAIEEYNKLFKEAFPKEKDPISAKNIGLAIGAFERTLVTKSRFDEYLDGNLRALKRNESKGLKLFINKGCSSCHSGTYLGGNSYKKFGVYANYWEYIGDRKIDEGRFNITKLDADKYVFKVAPLRNVVKTAPYFHNGLIDHIKDAVRIMGKVQLNVELTNGEIENIVLFLNSLTGKISKRTLRLPILPQN